MLVHGRMTPGLNTCFNASWGVSWIFPVAQVVKNLAAMQETQV